MEDIVTKAENVIKNISRDKYNNILLKTNQIRRIAYRFYFIIHFISS